jgi:hypothetical protein
VSLVFIDSPFFCPLTAAANSSLSTISLVVYRPKCNVYFEEVKKFTFKKYKGEQFMITDPRGYVSIVEDLVKSSNVDFMKNILLNYLGFLNTQIKYLIF